MSLIDQLRAARAAEDDAETERLIEALRENDDPREWSFRGDADGADDHTCSPSEVRDYLHGLALGGDWGEVDKTIWVEGYAHCELTGENVRVVTQIDPDAPECSEAKHDWQSPEFLGGLKENPGVWGHGGGVLITTCCMHCGCKRVEDTWAQNPSTGEQGLESVHYEVGFFTEQLAELAEEAA